MVLFGPGVGECILLHLGNGDWIVVDSCPASNGSGAIALDYLAQIKVDPAESIRCIIATHWHDDHILGISKILRECPKAKFMMSAALSSQQFYSMVMEVHARNRLVKATSTASEFNEIIEILASRVGGKYPAAPTMYLNDGSRVFQGGHCGKATLWALSPSAATIANAQTDLGSRLLTSEDVKTFKRFSPNDLSVVILTQFESFSLLLGADLETQACESFGWKAVLNSDLHPVTRSQVFKVAHHGANNGDHPEIWKHRLIDKPLSLMTPFIKLADPLPKESDINRIKTRTDQIYCTTWPISKAPIRRRNVDGIVKGMTRVRRAINPEAGFVRMRIELTDPSASPTIEVFGSARRL